MKNLVAFVVMALTASLASAIPLSCRVDADTNATICYAPKSLRVNGDLRSFELFSGGPKGVGKDSNTGVANCKVGYIELRDRRGVVFARDQPIKQHIRLLRDDICQDKKARFDRSLR